MSYADAVLSTSAGIAVFALVFAAAATALGTVFPDPGVISMPIGIGFGAATMTATYVGLAATPGSLEFRIAFASGAFGTTFLGLFVLTYGMRADLPFALLVGTASGLVVSGGVLLATR